jgi:hypothetical protein
LLAAKFRGFKPDAVVAVRVSPIPYAGWLCAQTAWKVTILDSIVEQLASQSNHWEVHDP